MDDDGWLKDESVVSNDDDRWLEDESGVPDYDGWLED